MKRRGIETAKALRTPARQRFALILLIFVITVVYDSETESMCDYSVGKRAESEALACPQTKQASEAWSSGRVPGSRQRPAGHGPVTAGLMVVVNLNLAGENSLLPGVHSNT